MAGGSQLVIDNQGITITTNGKIIFKAGQHLFQSGERVSTELPFLPVPDQPYVLQYWVKNKENKPIENRPYFIIDEDGNIQKGLTDAKGFMEIKTTASAQNILTRIMTNEIEEAQDESSLED